MWLLVGTASAQELPKYDNGLLQLAAAFSAKEACSCVFVAERPIAECRRWVRVSPAVARFRVVEKAKEVRSTALLTRKTVARWVDAEVGCVITSPLR
jgi:hypothetical protein